MTSSSSDQAIAAAAAGQQLSSAPSTEAASLHRAHSIRRVTELTDAGRSTIYAEIGAGRLKARKIGRKTVILDSDLQEWLNSLPLLKEVA